MTPSNDKQAGPVDAALASDSMPLWLWDPAAARIVWANRASLEYSGARSLDDLKRLHFRAGDSFARQLAAIAARDLGAAGSHETIRFDGGRGERAWRFLCRNVALDDGRRGLLLGLLGAAEARPVDDKPEPAPKKAKRREPSRPPVPVAPSPAPPLPERSPPVATAPKAEPLIIDPQGAGYGVNGGAVDEEDLLTLQEIARLINGAASFAAVAPPSPPAKPATRPDIRNGARPPAAPAAGDEPVAAPSASPPQVERNYFLEAVPAAIAIAMGGRLMRANEAFLNAFGFAAESELHAAGDLAALFPESRDGVFVAAATGLRKPPRSARLSALAVSRSGRRRQVPLAFRSVSTGREPVQVLVLLEELSWQDDRLPAKPAAGSDAHLDFLARVSHEIRTPLNSIIGFAELASDESLGQNDIRVLRGYARDIHTSALHALSLVNDLLDISKIVAGKPELDLAPLDANEVVREALALTRPQIDAKRIDLTTRLGEALPRLLADRRAVLQILLNLITNAVKFTSPGGRIAVATGHDPQAGVTLGVADTGIGMCRDDIAVALQPFRQLEKGLAAAGSRDKGTGLGLPLSKALAEAHGAAFIIDSTPGLGTRVDLRFPPDRLAS